MSVADQLQADPKSSLRSPLLWLGGHVNLPPTYMQIAGMDQSRDQGLLYDEILRKEGVKTRVDIFPGLPHGFHNFLPKAGFTLEFKERTRLGFEWLLSCGL
jgi:acetyl esterase/lipase